MNFQTIQPTTLNTRLATNTNSHLLDVRSPAEFETVHATPATNIPLDRFDAQTYLSGLGEGVQHVYVICKSGARSAKACERLASVATTSVEITNVTGGTDAWEAAGLPVVRGKQTISIDRQVRIVAGALVFLGVALGWAVHPGFLGVSAFVGAGLVFAGVTNTCAMAHVLARMPWNQTKPSQPVSTAPAAQCDTGG